MQGDPLTRDPNIHYMYASQYTVIPLPGILTYTKCMLVHAPNHTSYIFFVNDNFITWQITKQLFTLNTHTFRILSKIFTSLRKLSSFLLISNVR